MARQTDTLAHVTSAAATNHDAAVSLSAACCRRYCKSPLHATLRLAAIKSTCFPLLPPAWCCRGDQTAHRIYTEKTAAPPSQRPCTSPPWAVGSTGRRRQQQLANTYYARLQPARCEESALCCLPSQVIFCFVWQTPPALRGNAPRAASAGLQLCPVLVLRAVSRTTTPRRTNLVGAQGDNIRTSTLPRLQKQQRLFLSPFGSWKLSSQACSPPKVCSVALLSCLGRRGLQPLDNLQHTFGRPTRSPNGFVTNPLVVGSLPIIT